MRLSRTWRSGCARGGGGLSSSEKQQVAPGYAGESCTVTHAWSLDQSWAPRPEDRMKTVWLGTDERGGFFQD